MACLLRYRWLKLPRSIISDRNGILGHWAHLSARAAFRKGIASYEEDAFPAVPMDYLLILIAGLLVCIAVLICLKLATPKSSDDDDFDDYDE